MDLPTLERKLLRDGRDGRDGRGGYCFELNRLFLALLQHLGFEAAALAGRVIEGDAPLARTHLLLLVTAGGEPYVVDVGGMVPTAPVRLHSEESQTTHHEPYQSCQLRMAIFSGHKCSADAVLQVLRDGFGLRLPPGEDLRDASGAPGGDQSGRRLKAGR